MESSVGPKEKVTASKKNQFMDVLKSSGGSLSNAALRRALEWREDIYSRVHGRLLEEGLIRTGRGRGGTVLINEDIPTSDFEPSISEAIPVPLPTFEADPKLVLAIPKERDLYTEELRLAIVNWFRQKGVEELEVEPTHSRGSKSTGGTFTRPDYTAALRKEYRYLPKTIEVITFEIKPESDVTVLGVMEALSHRESSHRAFVLYALSSRAFNASQEGKRIIELASKYGVGVIVSDTPGDLESWEILVEEERNVPDPDRLERFINDLPEGKVKEKLAKWK